MRTAAVLIALAACGLLAGHALAVSVPIPGVTTVTTTTPGLPLPTTTVTVPKPPPCRRQPFQSLPPTPTLPTPGPSTPTPSALVSPTAGTSTAVGRRPRVGRKRNVTVLGPAGSVEQRPCDHIGKLVAGQRIHERPVGHRLGGQKHQGRTPASVPILDWDQRPEGASQNSSDVCPTARRPSRLRRETGFAGLQNRRTFHGARSPGREPDPLPTSKQQAGARPGDISDLRSCTWPVSPACDDRRSRGRDSHSRSDRRGTVRQRLPGRADGVPGHFYLHRCAFERCSRDPLARGARLPETSNGRPRSAPRRRPRSERSGDRPCDSPIAGRPPCPRDRPPRNRFAPSRRRARIPRGRPLGHAPWRNRRPRRGRFVAVVITFSSAESSPAGRRLRLPFLGAPPEAGGDDDVEADENRALFPCALAVVDDERQRCRQRVAARLRGASGRRASMWWRRTGSRRRGPALGRVRSAARS